MTLTTGAILRRITQTPLSVSAHKLATLILDGIAWKDGYNGLPRGCAAFALSELSDRMAISRQYLHTLLAELAASGLRLLRNRLRGRPATWMFRFGCNDETAASAAVSSEDDTAPYREDSHKNVFSGMIVLDCERTIATSRWLAVIDDAKSALPCRTSTNRHIWDRFLAFNRNKGQKAVPAGYLLGFMRRWKAYATKAPAAVVKPSPQATRPPIPELQHLIALAPIANRQFHQRDLLRAIGAEAYRQRVAGVIDRFDCGLFSAELAVHGMAVRAGELGR